MCASVFSEVVVSLSPTDPESVTAIEERAFYFCGSLNEVDLTADSNLKTIGNYAFRDTASLKNIYIPDTVSNIGLSIFYNNSDVVASVAEGRAAYNYVQRNGIQFTAREPLPIPVEVGTCGEDATWELWEDGL